MIFVSVNYHFIFSWFPTCIFIILLFSIFLYCSFLTYYRSIAVAAISCILLLLPVCSLGAVMCGTMGGGCGGLCPNQRRIPSPRRSKNSNTAARIVLRCGTQVCAWLMHCSWKPFLYLHFSLTLRWSFPEPFGFQCFHYFPEIVVFLVHSGAYIGFILGGLAMAFGSIIFLMASPLQRGCRDLKGPEYTFFEKVTITNKLCWWNHQLRSYHHFHIHVYTILQSDSAYMFVFTCT